jgi:thiamine-phosphate pyrophosphorylase
MKRKIGKLCVITDTAVQKKYSHIDIVKMAIEGGADIVQFRDKILPTGKLIDIAAKIRELCSNAGVTFIVNDRVDVAMISDSDGVHLGLDDIPLKEAGKLLREDKLIGGTAHNVREAITAQKAGADYIGFGHIYLTSSKFKDTPPVGVEGLKKVLKQIKIPILAIGGIGLNNIVQVIHTGVHGVALIGSVVKSKDPVNTIRILRKIIYAEER